MTITDSARIDTASSSSGITIEQQSATIGAEIGNVRLSGELSDDTIGDIRQALLDWKVLFFRDQDISTEEHLEFSKRFGELEIHPFGKSSPGHPEVLAITHDEKSPGLENGWHSDVTWRVEPSLGSVLRLLEGPTIGGDTHFADMYAAFDGLPDDVKEQVEGRTARHDFTRFKIGLRKQGKTEEEIAEVQKQYPNPHHPVIRTHPETGRKGIYVNAAFTKEIDDMEADESARLLALLYAQATYPEYQARLRWQPNTVAFWDNRSVQHYASSDYYPNVRRVERVTIVGDAPYYDVAQAPAELPPRPFMGQIELRRKGAMVAR